MLTITITTRSPPAPHPFSKKVHFQILMRRIKSFPLCWTEQNLTLLGTRVDQKD